MYALAGALDPDSCFALSRATFSEMALAGITCVGEFHYLHHAPDGTPYDDPNAMGRAVLAAAADAGIRITLLDACYLHGGIERFRDAGGRRLGRARGPAARSARPRASARRSTASARSTRSRRASSRSGRRGGRCTPTSPSSRRRTRQCLAAHGRTPTGLLADAGALSERFTAVHATHLTDDDVALLGGAGVTACLCPTTERDLADGIGPARRLLDAGASLATGSDSQAVIDPFEEARAIELDERLATGVRGVHARDGAPARGDRERLRRARLARRRPDRGGRAGGPHDGLARRRPPRRHARGGGGRRPPSSPPRPPTCGTSWSTAAGASATGSTWRSTSRPSCAERCLTAARVTRARRSTTSACWSRTTPPSETARSASSATPRW